MSPRTSRRNATAHNAPESPPRKMIKRESDDEDVHTPEKNVMPSVARAPPRLKNHSKNKWQELAETPIPDGFSSDDDTPLPTIANVASPNAHASDAKATPSSNAPSNATPPDAVVQVKLEKFDDDEVHSPGKYASEIFSVKQQPTATSPAGSPQRVTMTDIRGTVVNVTIEDDGGFIDADDDDTQMAESEITSLEGFLAFIQELLQIESRHASKVNQKKVTEVITKCTSILKDVNILRDYGDAVRNKSWMEARNCFRHLETCLKVFIDNKRTALLNGPELIPDKQSGLLERLKYVHKENYPLEKMERTIASSIISTMVASKPKRQM